MATPMRSSSSCVSVVSAAATSKWSLLSPEQQLNPNREILGQVLDQMKQAFRNELKLKKDTDLSLREKEDVDVVVSGGGLRGYYVVGADMMLRELCALRGNKIVRFAGASAGSWCAMFMCVGLHTLDWIETFYESQLAEREHPKLLDCYDKFMDSMMLKILPDDAYLKCTDRLFISVTVLSSLGPVNTLISKFNSNEDLIQACVASSTIPFLSTSGFSRFFRGQRVFDGGFTNNIPCFGDFVRRQLVFDLGKVAYPFSMSLSPSDPCIESLVFRGALEMRRFCFAPQAPLEPVASTPRHTQLLHTPHLPISFTPAFSRMLPTSRQLFGLLQALCAHACLLALVRRLVDSTRRRLLAFALSWLLLRTLRTNLPQRVLAT